MTQDASFFSEHIPQSEYRKGDSHTKERQVLSVHLDHLHIKDAKTKHDLIQKIEEEADRLIALLLPEELGATVAKEEFLPQIMVKLGLI